MPARIHDYEKHFWAKVDKSGDCWVWLGSVGWNNGIRGAGYGQFYVARKLVRAHRFAWEITRGSIPRGMYVLHRCDNVVCVRPEHLFIGTHKDNMEDRTAKGRNPRNGFPGELNPNHKLSDAQVRNLRLEYANTKVTQKELGKKYGVSQSAVSRCIRGERKVAIP